MQSKQILTITLNPAIDKTVYCSNFKRGQDHRCSEVSFSAGGKGINVSRVLKQLATPTLATGYLGGSNGDYILKQLSLEEIPYKFINISGQTRTSLTIIDKESSNTTRILEQGPSIAPDARVAFLELFSKLSDDASWVIISGRSPAGIGDDFYQKMLEICQHKQIKTVLDSSGIHFAKGLYSKPTLIKPNIDEAQELLSYPIENEDDLRKACIDLKEKGCKYVCISRAEKGAVLYDGQSFYFGHVPKLKQESPVGCGDAFIAGFCSAYQKGMDIELCFKEALACGCSNALNNQPGKLDLASLEQIKKNIRISKKY